MSLDELKALPRRRDERIPTPEHQQSMDTLAELAKTDLDAAELLKLEQAHDREVLRGMGRQASRKAFVAKIRRLFGR